MLLLGVSLCEFIEPVSTFLYVRFLSLLLALQQAQVHRKRNSYASSIAFSSLEVLPVLHLGRFHTSPIMVFYLLVFLIICEHSKKPKFAKIGVRVQKLLQFFCSHFLSAVSAGVSAEPSLPPECFGDRRNFPACAGKPFCIVFRSPPKIFGGHRNGPARIPVPPDFTPEPPELLLFPLQRPHLLDPIKGASSPTGWYCS